LKIRRIIPVLPLAAALLAAPAAVTSAAAATSATATAQPATTILGPCTPLEDGHYMVLGRGRNARLYECRHVTGLGFYWVDVPACPGGVSTAARPAC